MKQLVSLTALAIALAACAGNPPLASTRRPTSTAQGANSASESSSSAALARAAATITPEDMYRRIAYLSSDALGGRDTPSPGLETAAAWVADQFRTFGLRPAGDSGTYVQRWPYKRSSFIVSGTTLRIAAGSSAVTPIIGADFFLLPAAGVPGATGTLVWAGTAHAGRAALGPEVARRFVAFFLPGKDTDKDWQAGIQAAALAALGAGPAGVIVILDPAFDDGEISQIVGETAAQELPAFLIGLSYASAKQVFSAAGQDLDALRSGKATTLLPLSNTNVSISVAREVNESQPPNVVGILEGSDPALRNEYVVVGGHMDHIGIGPPDASGDSIFNGADDDASGTSTMIEVAQAFASLPARPARSMIFLGVSGEEKGLLGSAYFTEHTPVPRDHIVADINLDMVGRNAPDTVVAIGQDYSSLGPVTQKIAKQHPELGLVVAPDLWPEEGLFFRSDHFNFARAGIPAIFFTTGLHPQYHKQSDEVQLIDEDKVSRVGRLVFYLAWEVANAPQAPKWTAKGLSDVRAMTANVH